MKQKHLINELVEIDRAELIPLNGKYYSTEIKIYYKNSDNTDIINVVTGTIFDRPSDRELKRNGITLEEWNNNESIDNGWGGYSPLREVFDFEQSHTESQFDYYLALSFVDAINNMDKFRLM